MLAALVGSLLGEWSAREARANATAALHAGSLSSEYKSPASPSNPQPTYTDGGFLLYGLPGLSIKAFVNRLCDGRLHQIHISNHQRGVQILQVFVELSIAQVICAGEEREDVSGKSKASACSDWRERKTKKTGRRGNRRGSRLAPRTYSLFGGSR